jgi:peptide/nickel transport system permease protein
MAHPGSWLSALVVIASGVLIGGLIGTVAGIAGGWLDTALMRFTDLFLALPAAVLAIAVIAALGASLPHTLVAVSIIWWSWYARIVRGEVRAQAVRSHVDAARLAGVGRTRLALRHLLPGAFPAVLVTASLDVGGLVLILAGLSFIGLGSPPPAPELGAMTARGMPYPKRSRSGRPARGAERVGADVAGHLVDAQVAGHQLGPGRHVDAVKARPAHRGEVMRT